MRWFNSWFIALICLIFAKSSFGAPVELSEETWSQMLEGEWMIEFYAPWCPACKALTPIWNDFALWSRDLKIRVAQIDITVNPGLSGRFMVTALPTIYHVKDGMFRQYMGGRDRDSLLSFVEEKKWEAIKPISTWKHPDSFQMGTVAQFFRWSYAIRGVHTYLVDSGVPYWASYGLFALATIVIGALLGLIIVAVIDVVFAPKPIDYQKLEAQGVVPEDSDLAEGSEASSASPKQSPKEKKSKSKSKKID